MALCRQGVKPPLKLKNSNSLIWYFIWQSTFIWQNNTLSHEPSCMSRRVDKLRTHEISTYHPYVAFYHYNLSKKIYNDMGGPRNSSRRGGGFWAGILQGGGGMVQVRGNFHILTSKKKPLWWGFNPPNTPPPRSATERKVYRKPHTGS